MTKQFQEIEYSGDVGIEAWGQTTADMLANAARGLFALMAGEGVTPVVARAIQAECDSPEVLVADWLSEIITSAATHGEVYCEVEVGACTDTEVSATVWGEVVNPGRHALRFEVKAATYHNLLLEIRDGLWYSRVILDL